MSARNAMTSPRGVIPEKYPLYAVAALIAITILTVFASRFAEVGHQTLINQEIIDTMTLHFSDGEEGAIIVKDATTGAETFRYEPGEGGFARTALRAMAFRREIEGEGAREPMLLHLTAKNRVILFDPVTEQSIGVNAFGQENAAQFAILFNSEEARP